MLMLLLMLMRAVYRQWDDAGLYGSGGAVQRWELGVCLNGQTLGHSGELSLQVREEHWGMDIWWSPADGTDVVRRSKRQDGLFLQQKE